MKIAIGADIGGGHITCVAIDLENEIIIENSETKINVDNQATKHEILQNWSTALLQTLKISGAEKIEGIGLAMPGPFDYEKGIALFERVAKFESLYGANITEELQSLLGFSTDFPIRFMNDATSFAVGEAWIGTGKNDDKIIALTLGTGFGSAFIENRIPVLEGTGIPELGCVWHLPFKNGIADDYISTRWVTSEFEKQTGLAVAGVKEIAENSEHSKIAMDLFTELE